LLNNENNKDEKEMEEEKEENQKEREKEIGGIERCVNHRPSANYSWYFLTT
jgi:hypothetical protein